MSCTLAMTEFVYFEFTLADVLPDLHRYHEDADHRVSWIADESRGKSQKIANHFQKAHHLFQTGIFPLFL